jgi:hypothetical protein
MPAVPEWDVLLRGGVLRALGQRGCRSSWTVSNFRGRARLHITAQAGDGNRKQLLLPYPWESDQLEAIRDGVVAVYEAFRSGVTLDRSWQSWLQPKRKLMSGARKKPWPASPRVCSPVLHLPRHPADRSKSTGRA